MTEWEGEYSKTWPEDSARFFRQSRNGMDGYEQYGVLLYNIENTESLTEDSGQAAIHLLKANGEDEDAVAPLPCGTFARLMMFGRMDNYGNPVWEYEENGEPKNFRNYYLISGNSLWFEYLNAAQTDRYKHDYVAEEIIACLKDYPVRSTKTFQAGAYTFRECLEILFEIAFRPRSLGEYSVGIKPCAALDAVNDKLEYTNATLYDAVTDIARIVDMVPSMELKYENGVYVFELYFLDRYGLEGDVHDISEFNMVHNDGINRERDMSAGSCISNVENLMTKESDFPISGQVYPNETNPNGGNDWSVFQVPYPIDEVSEIRVYWQYDIAESEKQDNTFSITLFNGRKYTPAGNKSIVATNLQFSSAPTKFFKITREDNGTQPNMYLTSTIDKTANPETSPTKWKPSRLYLAEQEEYNLLQQDVGTGKGKINTITYARGGTTIDLSKLSGNSMYWLQYYCFDSPVRSTQWLATNLTSAPNDNVQIANIDNANNRYTISITYRCKLNGAIRGENSKSTDITCYFNQYGQVVDIKSFGSALQNYVKTMNGETRTVARYCDKKNIRAMYESLPKVGSSVVDNKRSKRYVISGTAFTRKPGSGEFLATLTESRTGKSRVIIADNSQTIYAIPNSNIVDSKSHTHIICKLGRWSFGHTPNTAIKEPYLFNAFIGNVHSGEKKPAVANLNIHTSEGDKSASVNIFNSRFRLSTIISFRMMTNSISEIKKYVPILYTDSKGKLDSIDFKYTDSDMQEIISFSQALKKDAYEIMNHTTQITWIEYGNLRVSDNIIDMSYFGNGEGVSDPLRLVLLSSRVRLTDDITSHTAASYAVTVVDSGESYEFTASDMTSIPAHVGWALVRGKKIIVLDNFDQMTDNVCKVYYDVEVKD